MVFWIKKPCKLLSFYQKTEKQLDFIIIKIIAVFARQLDCRYVIVEESPGSIKTQCQLTAGGGDLRDSATENRPPNQGKGETVW